MRPHNPAAQPDSAATLLLLVGNRSGRYADMVERAVAGQDGVDEESLFDEYDKTIAPLLARYVAAAQGANAFRTLLDEHYSSPCEDKVGSERRRLVLTALIAAYVEFHGRLAPGAPRLTLTQSKRVAAALTRIGGLCTQEQLYLHAVTAYDLAVQIYRGIDDHLARDRCLYLRSRARHRAERSAWRRAWLKVSALSCGYGYRPYRLLAWVGIQLAVFTVALVLLTGKGADAVFLSANNYLNPAAPSGPEFTYWAKSLLVLESFTGALTVTVFFALLVRRWFH